jgi:hypothetical protein
LIFSGSKYDLRIAADELSSMPSSVLSSSHKVSEEDTIESTDATRRRMFGDEFMDEDNALWGNSKSGSTPVIP